MPSMKKKIAEATISIIDKANLYEKYEVKVNISMANIILVKNNNP